jgi:hypothetical protein
VRNLGAFVLAEALWVATISGLERLNYKIRKMELINMKRLVIAGVLLILLTGCRDTENDSSDVAAAVEAASESVASITESASEPAVSASGSSSPRAIGNTDYGQVAVVPTGAEEIEQLGAPSCMGNEQDYRMKSDYKVVFNAKDGQQSPIAVPTFNSFIQPSADPVDLPILQFEGFQAAVLAPAYADCHGISFNLIGVMDHEAFSFKFQTDEGTFDSYSYSPVSKLEIVDNQLVVMMGAAPGNDEAPTRYFKPNIETHTLELVKMEPQASNTTVAKLIPFTKEEITSISVTRVSDGKVIPYDPAKDQVLNSALDFIYSDAMSYQSAGHLDVDANQAIQIKYTTSRGNFVYNYQYDINAIIIGDKPNYLGIGVYRFFAKELEPESEFGELVKLQNAAYEELLLKESPTYDESFRQDSDKMTIGGKDYNAWEKELNQRTPERSVPYFDPLRDGISHTSVYPDGIILSDLLITFSTTQYSTKDGIKVGLTKAQVLKMLGEPNMKLKTEWSYFQGDYLKFKLLFQDDKLKYIELRMPV